MSFPTTINNIKNEANKCHTLRFDLYLGIGLLAVLLNHVTSRNSKGLYRAAMSHS